MTNLYGYNKEYNAINDVSPFGISAGGVVYRKVDQDFEFLLLGRTEETGITYHLPKGTLHVDETLESCAIREIAEEAGVEVELKAYIGARAEEYQQDENLYRKTLHYYVAEFLSEAESMDNEHDFKEWCSFEDAIAKLSPSIKQENEFIVRANQYLHNQLNG